MVRSCWIMFLGLALFLGGCGDRDGEDWIGLWSEGDPTLDDDTAGDDDSTGDDDTTPDDLDGDGWSVADGDCDDGDALVYPGAPEQCNGVDDDCDGAVPADEVDGDGDGVSACGHPSGTPDCDDQDPLLNPLDLDADGFSTCDGDCDDADSALTPEDADGDLHSTCDGDCADQDGTVYPGAPELCGFGIDNDCDTEVDEGCDCPMYVDANALPGSQPGAWDDPFASIADALGAVGPACHEIHVLPGTYTDELTLSGQPLVLRSIGGPGATQIHRNLFDPCMTIDGVDRGLDGFTVRLGRGATGGGLELVGGSAEIVHCVFSDNLCAPDGLGAAIYARDVDPLWIRKTVVQDNICDAGGTPDGSDGGGLWAETSVVAIEDNRWLDNQAGDGGGLALHTCTGLLRHNLVADNEADDATPGAGTLHGGGGILVVGPDLELVNNLVTGNASDDRGGGLLFKDTAFAVTLRNNTVVYNSALTDGAGIHADLDGGVILDGDIVAFNQGTAGIGADDPPDQPDASYSDVYSNLPVDYAPGLTDPVGNDGNLAVDPLFLAYSPDGDPDNDDFHLDPGSACVDTGNPALTDPDGSDADMGCYGGPDGDW